MKTQCNNCGVITDRQPPGDGCHACMAGTMKPIDKSDIECQQCGFSGGKEEFIDGNTYSIFKSDDLDCPVCGATI